MKQKHRQKYNTCSALAITAVNQLISQFLQSILNTWTKAENFQITKLEKL